VTIEKAGSLKIELIDGDGTTHLLKDGVPVLAGEVVDGTFMSVAKLREFLAAEIADAKDKGILFSLHMKATMMKVSDPIKARGCFGRSLRKCQQRFGQLVVRD